MEAKKIADLLVNTTRAGWINQGHNLTGAGAASIQGNAIQTGNETRIAIVTADYVAQTDRGTPWQKIPYSPNSGAKTSQYIQGLQNYARLRFGQNDKEALNTAFRIAYVQKLRREGSPSVGSKAFSKTGRRTGFAEAAYQEALPEIMRIIADDFLKSATRQLANIPNR
jgi:hypothetical protein